MYSRFALIHSTSSGVGRTRRTKNPERSGVSSKYPPRALMAAATSQGYLNTAPYHPCFVACLTHRIVRASATTCSGVLHSAAAMRFTRSACSGDSFTRHSSSADDRLLSCMTLARSCGCRTREGTRGLERRTSLRGCYAVLPYRSTGLLSKRSACTSSDGVPCVVFLR